jgi:hypothetical protein
MIFDKTTKIAAAIAAFLIGVLGLYATYNLALGTYGVAVMPSSQVIYNTVACIAMLLLSIASFMVAGALYRYYSSRKELLFSKSAYLYAGLGFFGIAFASLLALISTAKDSLDTGMWNTQSLFMLIVTAISTLVIGKLLVNQAFHLKPHERATGHVLRHFGVKRR